MPQVFSQGQGSSVTQTQRPRSLPLRRRAKESLKAGKQSSSSKGGVPTSTSLSKKGEGGATPSATDFVRVMRTLLFLTRPSSKGKNSGDDKEAWKPRTSLDVSGHSFSKSLKAELRRAKEAQGHTDLEALSHDSSPFQAALRHQHLAQLRSPTKGGFSSYKDWADDKSDTNSRASFTSTLPPSPPPSRAPTKSALPPRCPPKGGGGFPPKAGGGSRRARQPCAVREQQRTNAAGFVSARPAAGTLVG